MSSSHRAPESIPAPDGDGSGSSDEAICGDGFDGGYGNPRA